MKLPPRVIALALPLLWGCADEGLTAVERPPEPRFNTTGDASGIPLVYDVENTGARFPKPYIPLFSELAVIPRLPDPFQPINGGPVDLSFGSWEARRNEFKASIEAWEIGPKPDASDVNITAAYANGMLTVTMVRKANQRALTITAPVYLPAGTGPFPAVIGMSLAPGNGTGSLPSDIFTSRNIARIDYLHNQVTEYAAGVQVSHAGDPFYFLYPEFTVPGNAGQYAAWSWGVSRLIDGLQIAAKQAALPLPIDTRRLAVTGCSYAGKMALFAGAFDERIALTIAQESGGGGAPAWRVNHGIEPNGTVEKIDNTDGSWFKQDMKTQFRGDNVYKLPHDHHELMAMVAPRALLVTGNTDFTWLGNRANYVTSRATQEIYKTLGIGDRFGFFIDGGHGHCAIPASQRPAISAFVDKFLLGKDANTNVEVFPQTAAFTGIDYQAWMPWANRTVPDVTAPVIQTLTASSPTLWPPNHRMEPVTFTASVSDDTDPAPATRIISVSSSEAETGLGDGDVGPDWEITGPMTANVRVERFSAAGRVYTITVESRDASGNASTRTVTVRVPHTQ